VIAAVMAAGYAISFVRIKKNKATDNKGPSHSCLLFIDHSLFFAALSLLFGLLYMRCEHN
jgi:hypothetical protein